MGQTFIINSQYDERCGLCHRLFKFININEATKKNGVYRDCLECRRISLQHIKKMNQENDKFMYECDDCSVIETECDCKD